MTISKDLLLAILSMDAYNRGYNEGISGLGGIDSKIGAATIKRQSNIQEDSTEVAASFYAVAYDVDGSGIAELDGTTVISYRGTDEPASELLFTDFPISFGGVWQQQQLYLASQFYDAVRENGDNAELSNNDLYLTGHSLGGALAGFTGAFKGTKATVVDHIGFNTAFDNFLVANVATVF